MKDAEANFCQPVKVTAPALSVEDDTNHVLRAIRCHWTILLAWAVPDWGIWLGRETHTVSILIVQRQPENVQV